MYENVLLKLIHSLIRNPVMEEGKQNSKQKVKKEPVLNKLLNMYINNKF